MLGEAVKIFGLVGWSGSGKTTLMTGLLPELIGRGLSVSTMKHTHHTFDMDRRGKDSYEHRAAGATEVLVTSSARWALLHELRDTPEPNIDELLGRMAPVDLVLIEGFKTYPHDKLEVFRSATGKSILCPDDPTIVAVASDDPLSGLAAPVLDLDDFPAIADFIIGHCGLEDRPSSQAGAGQ